MFEMEQALGALGDLLQTVSSQDLANSHSSKVILLVISLLAFYCNFPKTLKNMNFRAAEAFYITIASHASFLLWILTSYRVPAYVAK